MRRAEARQPRRLPQGLRARELHHQGHPAHSPARPQVTAQSATTALIEGARAGAAFWIGVSYTSPAGRAAMHSLNVWGVRYTTEGDQQKLSGIWIADSDDYKSGLTYVAVREDAGMLVFHCPDHPIYSRMPRIVIDTVSIINPPTFSFQHTR